jgi:glutamate synthase domain-containing protein 1
MCGIVSLYLKNPDWQSRLGALFEPMLISMTDRGPDSAGFAIYGDVVGEGRCKLTVRGSMATDWQSLAELLKTQFNVEWFNNSNVAVFKCDANQQVAIDAIQKYGSDELIILSSGQSIEILKEIGLPATIAKHFNLAEMKGSHIIGHTRMATESAVTTLGSHPFTTGSDLCLVHNGSLSNHNSLRRELKRQGIIFHTENDSEVAAGYLSWRLSCGDSLDQALSSALNALDGFYTFAIGSADGFAVLRDPISCKPALLAETDDYVAMASEYQALRTLPDIEKARLWEPEPAKVYVWQQSQSAFH